MLLPVGALMGSWQDLLNVVLPSFLQERNIASDAAMQSYIRFVL